MRLSLRARVSWVTALSSGLLLLFVAWSAVQTRLVGDRLVEMNRTHFELVNIVLGMEANFLEATTELRAYLDDGDPRHVADLAQHQSDFGLLYQSYVALAFKLHTTNSIPLLQSQYARLSSVSARLVEVRAQRQRTAAALFKSIDNLRTAVTEEGGSLFSPLSSESPEVKDWCCAFKMVIQSLEGPLVERPQLPTNYLDRVQLGYAHVHHFNVPGVAQQAREQTVRKLETALDDIGQKAVGVLETDRQFGSLLEDLDKTSHLLSRLPEHQVSHFSGDYVENVSTEIDRLTWDSTLASAVLLLVIVVLGWLTVRKLNTLIVKPLTQLIEAKYAIASGNLNQQVDLSAAPEFRLLGDAFNIMVASLQDAEARVSLLNEGLEERVRQRTQELALAHEKLQTEAAARTRAQEAALAREKAAATGRMAARIAHEINNPLNGIRASLLIVERALSPEHPDFEFLGRIRREIERIAAITRRMFALYKPPPDRVLEFSLTTLVTDVVQLSEASARGRNVRLRGILPEGPCPVRLPEAAVSEVLYNLVKNAIEASPEGGEVRVELTRNAEQVRLIVADQGKGLSSDLCGPCRRHLLCVSRMHLGKNIPARFCMRIFEPFVSTKTGSGTQGLGMGLAITKTQVESMRGRLSFRSLSGQGATFEVRLPLDSSARNQ